jgi:hypothetical protein
MYFIAVAVIIFILVMSIFFLIRSYRRGVEIGMSKKILKNSIVSTAIFTIAPAISILIGIITLSKFLGIPLPWIRMSVIGALTYELPAASATASALNISLSKTITDPKVFSAIAWVMTIGILPSIVLTPILMKRIQGGIIKIKEKDSKWGDIFLDAMFLGMISAFLGMVFGKVQTDKTAGMISILVLITSAILMGACGLLIKKRNMKWLETYALSISMIGSMVLACIITHLVL